MPDYLSKIVYLTEAQKETLFSAGTITVNNRTITYNENDLYLTPDPAGSTPVSGPINALLATTYTATLAASSWTNTTPSTYSYSNASLKCGSNGLIAPIIKCTSNDLEYATITSAQATAGTGISFAAPSAPTNDIGISITDFS